MRAWTAAVVATLTATWAGAARAQSPATCSFDQGTATVTVTVNVTPATVRAVKATGEIHVDGQPCGAATVNNTDTIQVNGNTSTQPDTVSFTGSFAPGLTPEGTGGSEIEIYSTLRGNGDELVVFLTARDDRLRFASNGIDIGNDLDADIFTGGISRVTINAGDGNDRVDASAYSQTGLLALHGRVGDDELIGAPLALNWLYGEDGNDTLRGGGLEDHLWGGMGDDVMFGGGANDWFHQAAFADGADDMRGGDGRDTVDYVERSVGVTVTIGSSSLDGEPGEGDRVRGDVEDVRAGRGPDILVGNSGANYFWGDLGDDELYGAGGDDILDGFAGSDLVIGDDGDDTLVGGSGNDFLEGGDGADEFRGQAGNDIIANQDGTADEVDCGDGAADDAEADPLDTFMGCEL